MYPMRRRPLACVKRAREGGGGGERGKGPCKIFIFCFFFKLGSKPIDIFSIMIVHYHYANTPLFHDRKLYQLN